MKHGSSQANALDLLGAWNRVARSALARDGIETALNELGAAIAGSPRPAPRRPRPRARISRPRAALVLAAAVLVIGAGVATGAGVFSAHTGRYPTKAERAMGGPGEALNPAAPDFRAVALKVASDIPYPSGYVSWREFLISNEIRFADDGVLESTGALHGWFAASAFCAWVQSWRQASIAGDREATALAARTIAQAPQWKAVTAEDPHADPSAPNDPGAETGTLFGWLLPYRDAVLSGNRARVEQLLASGFGDGKCWSSDPAWMAQVRMHEAGWRRLAPRELALKYEQFLAEGGS
jgi:hypothetical protein